MNSKILQFCVRNEIEFDYILLTYQHTANALQISNFLPFFSPFFLVSEQHALCNQCFVIIKNFDFEITTYLRAFKSLEFVYVTYRVM